MSSVTQTTATGANIATASTAAAGANSPTNLQNTFLKLLVTQLQNQDPTNPTDSSQMVTQMAQISTVSGVTNLNTTLSGLASQLSAAQSLQAANLIGKTVLAPTTGLTLANGQAQGAIALSGDADHVTVEIDNAAGQKVDSMDLGAQSAGQVKFTWDGTNSAGTPVADGAYSVKVTATQGSNAVDASLLGAGQVSSVNLNNGSATLTVAGIGQVPLSSVSGIY